MPPKSLPQDLRSKRALEAIFRSLPEQGVKSVFPDEEACQRRLMEVRWPTGPVCPHCASRDLRPTSRWGLYHCTYCRKQPSIRYGTVLERSNTPLRTWFLATEIFVSAYFRGREADLLSRRALQRRLGIGKVAVMTLTAKLPCQIIDTSSLLARCVSTQAPKTS